MDRSSSHLVGLAQRYCELIEAAGPENPSWLEEVAALLPELYASAIDAFGSYPYEDIEILTPDLDARCELYTHLLELLGDRNPYWLESDRVGDFPMMTGSLADDLTDIYCELKHGFLMAPENPELLVATWGESFSHHWDRHLTDAEGHLAALAVQKCL